MTWFGPDATFAEARAIDGPHSGLSSTQADSHADDAKRTFGSRRPMTHCGSLPRDLSVLTGLAKRSGAFLLGAERQTAFMCTRAQSAKFVNPPGTRALAAAMYRSRSGPK